MKAVKFLERQDVIRFFGICLFLAPFMNVAFNIYLQSQKSQVTGSIVWQSLTIGTFSQNMQNLLSVGSLGIGVMMILGRQRVWGYVLGLIGLHILIQTTTLLKDLKDSWIWAGVFIVNLGIFFFIADQLVFKEKRTEDESNEDSYQGLVTKKRIIIHFTDLKIWAQLIHISCEGLKVRSFESAEISLHPKPMVVFLRSDLKLPLLLHEVKKNEYFFKFLPMSKEEVAALNQWILEKSEVKRGSSSSDFNSLSFTQKVS
ncbi:hypothetical protein K2X05_11230 [bacterium]|nr:hypothetical protein [bacterium]